LAQARQVLLVDSQIGVLLPPDPAQVSFVRQPTHVPGVGPAPASELVTQTGVIGLSCMQSLVPTQPLQVFREAPASRPSSQIGFAPLQFWSARQLTHIPGVAASAADIQ
jgi:hypothetical protein